MLGLQHIVVGNKNILANPLIIWTHKTNAVFFGQSAYNLLGIMFSHFNNGTFAAALAVDTCNARERFVTINHSAHLAVAKE